MIRIAGGPQRLRPHCKTHKMREVIQLQLDRGISQHKCATLAEAEMLASAGVLDICLAYNLVGPNIPRAVRFVEKYPDVAFSVTADDPMSIVALGKAMSAAGKCVDVLLDIDTGQHRTGVPLGREALNVYRQIALTKGLRPGGLHVYDGQNHQTSLAERTAAVNHLWEQVASFRDELLSCGVPVPRIVAGGSPSFPIFAQNDDPTLQLSPGTVVFHDAGYSSRFADLDFQPAALLLTRVISRPTPNRVTFDLGYKAVAADPPANNRVVFPDVPDATIVLHNEEHLVIETFRAATFSPGDALLAIPWHICPTVALHQCAYVVAGGKVCQCWNVVARDRCLTI
jgi:D-serine deaminase-like pyridoxal phosphate-dependent protein